MEQEGQIMPQENAALAADEVTNSPVTPTAARRLGIDVRSRDAFELLQLGEAIVALKTDMRSLRLEKVEIRFERDRYEAAATDYQQKLITALEDLEQARASAQEPAHLRQDLIDLAIEFERRLEQESAAAQEVRKADREALREQLNTQAAAHAAELNETIALLEISNEAKLQDAIKTLKAEHGRELRESLSALNAKQETELRGSLSALKNEHGRELHGSLSALKADHESELRRLSALQAEHEGKSRAELINLSLEFYEKINSLTSREPPAKKAWWRER